jgi:UDP-glucuronate decarboxylase
MSPADGRVVSNFIVQALRQDDITIFGDGLQTRSFCYVDDTITAMTRMMETDDHITGPINIGNPEEVTMQDLAQLILQLTGSSSKLVYAPLPLDDPRQRRPNIDLAKKTLQWQPTINLLTGLEKTIEYFKEVVDETICDHPLL